MRLFNTTKKIPQLEKEYEVMVQGTVSSTAIDLLRHGLALDGVPLEPMGVQLVGEQTLRMVLTQGR